MPITHAIRLFATITALLLLASGVVARSKDTQLSVITFINRCQLPISIHENGIQVCKIKAGSKTNATGGCSRLVTSNNSTIVYRTDSQVGTKAKIWYLGKRIWYALDITPRGATNCKSYAACKAQTGRIGFDVGMSVLPGTPTIFGGANEHTCTMAKCKDDSCDDAYSHPGDRLKWHRCDANTPLLIAFCP